MIVNGSIQILLAADTEMEEAILKQFCKQQNEITEVRTPVTILNKTISHAVLIGKESNKVEEEKIKGED